MGCNHNRNHFSGIDVCGGGVMAGDIDPEKRQLTFAQREGKAPLPEVLQVGKLSRNFRKNLWKVVETSISNSQVMDMDIIFCDSNVFNDSDQGKFWEQCSHLYYFDVLDKNHDEIFPNSFHGFNEFRNAMHEIILDGRYDETLTVTEHILRTPGIPKELANSIKNVFEYAPYLLDISAQPICIIPVTSEEMKKNTKRALDDINQSELTGAKTHLRNAAQELNENKFADSVRESIHAVEATVRKIDPEESNIFSDALNSLEKNGILKHPALKEAFKKLYGYTNTEKGIRHPLIDNDVANVGFDEAIFMYAACVSFVDYLVSKKRQLKK